MRWVLRDIYSFLMPGSEQVLQGKTQLLFFTHPAPEGMVCHVQPSSGFEVHTHFSVFCTSGKEVCIYVGYHHLLLYHLTFESEWIVLITLMYVINILCKYTELGGRMLLPHRSRLLSLILNSGDCLCGISDVLLVLAWVSSGYFLLFKNMQIGYTKLPLGENECFLWCPAIP